MINRGCRKLPHSDVAQIFNLCALNPGKVGRGVPTAPFRVRRDRVARWGHRALPCGFLERETKLAPWAESLQWPSPTAARCSLSPQRGAGRGEGCDRRKI